MYFLCPTMGYVCHLFVCLSVSTCLAFLALLHCSIWPHALRRLSGWCYKSLLNSSVKGIECPPSDHAFQIAAGCPLWYLPEEQNTALLPIRWHFLSKQKAIIQTYTLNPMYTDIMPPKLSNSFSSSQYFLSLTLISVSFSAPSLWLAQTTSP